MNLRSSKGLPPLACSAQQKTNVDQYQSEPANITEIILAQSDSQSLNIVLPMLAHLSKQNRGQWLTWIAPPSCVNKNLLQTHDFDLRKVRLVYPKSFQDPRLIFWSALRQGNSGTVVINAEKMNEAEFEALEQAAQQGNTKGLVLRNR